MWSGSAINLNQCVEMIGVIGGRSYYSNISIQVQKNQNRSERILLIYKQFKLAFSICVPYQPIDARYERFWCSQSIKHKNSIISGFLSKNRNNEEGAPKSLHKTGDCVWVRPRSLETNVPLHVARIEKLEANNGGGVKIEVRWYYRPEEVIGGRKSFYGQKELILSDQYGTVSADSIKGKCIVHSLSDYVELNHIAEEDYYSRFSYKADTGDFSPAVVEVNPEGGDANLYKGLVRSLGSCGVVCAAIDTHTGEKVAVKKICDSFYAVQISREIRLLRLLRHPELLKLRASWYHSQVDPLKTFM